MLPVRLLSYALALFLLLAGGAPLHAEETILDYRADVVVVPDGTLAVTESITVRAENLFINHGIFRDFPTSVVNRDGRVVRVGFEVIAVTRNGAEEPWRTETIDGGVRVYVGDESVTIPAGTHRYDIRYATDRQIRFDEAVDVLSWNVTGNGWLFSIDRASATIRLPAGVQPRSVAAYTGAPGSRDSDAQARIDGSTAVVDTTRALGFGEGLTVDVVLPKGVVAPPSAEALRQWWWRDHGALVAGLGSVLLVLVFALASWLAVGRDPRPGVIVPRWDPPEGIPPGLAHYIDHDGFADVGQHALSAGLLELAVNGYVELIDDDGTMTIRRTTKPEDASVPPAQAALLAHLVPGSVVRIDKVYTSVLDAMRQAFCGAIEAAHRNVFHRTHQGLQWMVGMLSIAGVLACWYLTGLSTDSLLMVGLVSVSIFTVGWLSWRLLRSRNKPLLKRIRALVMIGVMALSSVFLVGLLIVDDHPDSRLMLAVAVAHTVAVLLFAWAIPAATPRGRAVKDHLEGLRRYLSLAETGRFNSGGAPAMSPSHFERLLPYAVALGVEKPWTRAFERWLAGADALGAAASHAYHPTWYAGNGASLAGTLAGFSAAVSTVTHLAVAASESGSSGGGSGHGGGGGGGGGW